MSRQTLKTIAISLAVCLGVSLIGNIITIVNYNKINNKLIENEELLSKYEDNNSDYQKENEQHSEDKTGLTEQIKDLEFQVSELTIENENLKYEMEKIVNKQSEDEDKPIIETIKPDVNNEEDTSKEENNETISDSKIEIEPKPEIKVEPETEIPEKIEIVQTPDPEIEVIIIPEKETVEEKTETEVETEPVEKIIDKYPDLYNSATNFKADPETKTAYLTFDDGPSKDTTLTILDKLDKYNIKATFFITGTNAEKNKELLKEIHKRGHLIGIHTYSHQYNDIYSSVDNYLEDFNKTYNLIYETIGVKPTIFRFPGGSINSYNKNTSKDIITEMNRRGFIYFDWNASSEDATTSPTFENCLKSISETMNTNKEVLLMHDTKKLTADNLEKYIEKIIELGYSFSTLKNVSPVQF